MSAADPVTPAPLRISICLPRPLWIGLATLGLMVLWLMMIAARFYLQGVAIREIEQAGGSVELRERGPVWLREWVGDERMAQFGAPVAVKLSYSSARDETLRRLHRLPGVKRLDLNGTKITDAGMAHVGGLASLEWLWLADSQVTDSGLAQLRWLTGIRELGLNGTQITDAGLAHLKTMTRLRELWLNGTQLTDAGLVHLKCLPDLEWVFLRGTQVSDHGIEDLKRSLPALQVGR